MDNLLPSSSDNIIHLAASDLWSPPNQIKTESKPGSEMKDKRLQKADREKLRRGRLNEQFTELGKTLDPERPKFDKATILCDTVQTLNDLTAQVDRLKSEYTSLTEESRELTQEKHDLREEKAWVLPQSLKDTFPLVYKMAGNKGSLVVDNYLKMGSDIIWGWAWKNRPADAESWAQSIQLILLLRETKVKAGDDNWVWVGDKGEYFSVKHVTQELTAATGDQHGVNNMKWCNWALPKANMFAWRALAGRIPTRVELLKRGINVGSTICSCCEIAEESVDHVLVSCLMAKSIWWSIGIWLRCTDLVDADNVSGIFTKVGCITGSKKQRKAAVAIIMATMWTIWLKRNARIFKGIPLSFARTVEEIKESTYLWMKYRTSEVISIEDWLKDSIFSIK